MGHLLDPFVAASMILPVRCKLPLFEADDAQLTCPEDTPMIKLEISSTMWGPQGINVVYKSHEL